MSHDGKVAIVTGGSSEIGNETSIALARSGIFTYATMRNLQNSLSDKLFVTILANGHSPVPVV